jgi:hypothetical protein
MHGPIFRAILRGITLITAGTLTACADMGFPETWELGGLRVLAIQASAPEVNPLIDGSFTITPVISDIDGAGRALEYTLEACYDPAVAYGVDPDCSNAVGDVTTRTGTFGGLAAPHYTGPVTESTAGDFTFTVPALVIAGLDAVDNAVELNNGVPFSVVLTVSDPATGEEVRSFRRIIASTRGTLNTNPSITGLIDSAGEALLVVPSSEDGSDIGTDIPDGVAETYIAKYRDGSETTETEEIRIAWFSSSGEFSRGQSVIDDFVTFTPPSAADIASGEEVAPFLYAIIRDDRGGVGLLAAPVGP